MNDRILSKEDILCMQYAGMKSSQRGRTIAIPRTERKYAHHAFCTQTSQTLSRGFISGIQ